MPKPIRIFFSPLSRRLYATRNYKEIKPGVVQVTGESYDVTDQIATLIKEHDIKFVPREEAPKHDRV